MKFGERISGPMGRAEQVVLEETDMLHVENMATIGLWFLTMPGQSVAWENYLLTIYHLRAVEGSDKEVLKAYPDVTHELVLIALDPERGPNPLDISSWRHLTPINFFIQLELPSDEKAMELLGLAARGVVDGLLWAEPPLSGQQEPWRTSMLQTSAHMRGEDHGGTPNQY